MQRARPRVRHRQMMDTILSSEQFGILCVSGQMQARPRECLTRGIHDNACHGYVGTQCDTREDDYILHRRRIAGIFPRFADALISFHDPGRRKFWERARDDLSEPCDVFAHSGESERVGQRLHPVAKHCSACSDSIRTRAEGCLYEVR